MPLKDRQARLDYARQYNKGYYRRNRDRDRKRAALRKKKIKKFFADYKARQSCAHCGENHPATLEFHHVDPDGLTDPRLRKYAAISTLIGGARSPKVIKAEIEKCQVLCSNCHRKHHWEEWGMNEMARRQHIESDLRHLLKVDGLPNDDE